MINTATPILLLAGAIGSGLVGGLFFVFSNTIMQAFDRLPPVQAIAAMQSINVTILNPLFFLAFFGTAVVALVVGILSIARWGESGALVMLTGALLYLVGSIVVTMMFNVPLNNRLAAVSLAGADLHAHWQEYRVAWTQWNHVRAVTSLLAAAAFAIGLSLG